MMHLIVAALTLAAGPSRPPRDVQDLVYLSPSGPVLIRLHIALDGKPFREAFDALIDGIFDSLDRNKDGVLSKEEAARAPELGGSGVRLWGRPGMATDARGNVTRVGLRAHYMRQGLVPFRITAGDGGGFAVFGGGLFLSGNQRSAAEITARLFKLLDSDKDGKLSRAELAAAEPRLLKFDADENELLALDELFESSDAGGFGDGMLAIALEAGGRVTPPVGFHALGDLASRAELAKHIKPVGRFRALDTNRDGKLAAHELLGIALLPADVEINLAMNSKTGQAEVKLQPGSRPAKTVTVRKGTTGGLVLEIGTVELTLGRPGGGFASFFNIDEEQQYKQIFTATDVDKNGYIDRKEAASQPFIGNQFDAIDADSDGMIFEKELLAFVRKMSRLQEKVKATTVSMSITESGQGLFDLLDLNRDGVLGVREMRRAPEVLARLRRDALSPADVPRQLSAGFAPGGSDGFHGSIRAVPLLDGSAGTPARPATTGPEWFRRMDRNGDGDVSRSEWLGTREEFEKIDTDRDGLISLDEAEAYDKRKRGR